MIYYIIFYYSSHLYVARCITIISFCILMYRWVGGKYKCVDLIRVFPRVELKTKTFSMRQTSLKSVQAKWSNMMIKTCSVNQHHLCLTLLIS